MISNSKGESQAQFSELNEKFRSLQEKNIDLSQSIKSDEIQIQSLKMEKAKLNNDVLQMKAKFDNYENEKYE